MITNDYWHPLDRDWPEVRLTVENIVTQTCPLCLHVFRGYATRRHCYACLEKH